MYAMYKNNDIKLELQPDDIYAIQSLYGSPEKHLEARVSSSGGNFTRYSSNKTLPQIV
jgi:hypothetical protein